MDGQTLPDDQFIVGIRQIDESEIGLSLLDAADHVRGVRVGHLDADLWILNVKLFQVGQQVAAGDRIPGSDMQRALFKAQQLVQLPFALFDHGKCIFYFLIQQFSGFRQINTAAGTHEQLCLQIALQL